MTLKPMDHEDVEEIIDTIFLPLVIPDDAARTAEADDPRPDLPQRPTRHSP